MDKKWIGKTKDLDLDGIDDIDVSDATKCANQGGTWKNGKCHLKFPQNQAKYGPDEYVQGEAGGAYEEPFTKKKRPDKKIVWFDPPRIPPGWANGTTYKADFVAIIRGTDGKYCYTKFTIDLERKAGPDKEEITHHETVDNADNVPGVP